MTNSPRPSRVDIVRPTPSAVRFHHRSTHVDIRYSTRALNPYLDNVDIITRRRPSTSAIFVRGKAICLLNDRLSTVAKSRNVNNIQPNQPRVQKKLITPLLGQSNPSQSFKSSLIAYSLSVSANPDLSLTCCRKF